MAMYHGLLENVIGLLWIRQLNRRFFSSIKMIPSIYIPLKILSFTKMIQDSIFYSKFYHLLRLFKILYSTPNIIIY